MALRAGDGVAPRLLVRAVARPFIGRAAGRLLSVTRGGVAGPRMLLGESAASWSSRLAFRLGRAPGRELERCRPIWGCRTGASGTAGYVRVLSVLRPSFCPLQPATRSAVVKTSVSTPRFFVCKLAVRAPTEVHLTVAWRTGRAAAQHSKSPAATRLIHNCSTPHTERYCSTQLHARRHSWYRRRRIERHRAARCSLWHTNGHKLRGAAAAQRWPPTKRRRRRRSCPRSDQVRRRRSPLMMMTMTRARPSRPKNNRRSRFPSGEDDAEHGLEGGRGSGQNKSITDHVAVIKRRRTKV